MVDLDALFPVTKFDPNMPEYKVEWLVNGLWQYRKINVVAGYVKSGKSRLTNWLLAGLVNGNSLGLECKVPERVLYLAGEEPIEHINNRLLRYGMLQNVDPALLERFEFINAVGMRLDFERYRTWMASKVKDYDLVIIDPFRRVHGAEENSNTEMGVINTEIRKWSNNFGCTVVFIHHTPKPSEESDLTRMENWMRGAGDIAAIVDTAVFIDKGANGRLVVRRDGRFAPLPPLIVRDRGNEPDMGFESMGVLKNG